MKKQFSQINNDAIFQFLRTYLVILILILCCCTICFHKAFTIVEENLIEENEYLMKQDISRIEDIFQEAYVNGMELNSSEALKHLGYMTSHVQPDYLNATQNVLNKYAEIVLRCNEWNGTVFTYLPRLDRVIFNNSIYRSQVFEVNYLEAWNLTDAEWFALCKGDKVFPYIYKMNNGDLLYVFPCLQSIQNTDRIGTTFIRINKEELLGYMSFWSKYSSFSFFVMQDNDVLISEDKLNYLSELNLEWLTEKGIYKSGDNLIFNILSEKREGRNYVLVIPQQEAMVGLESLRTFVWAMLFVAMIFGVLMAVFFSTRSGRPINNMMQMLKGYDERLTTYDLDDLNKTIAKMVQENKKDIVELRKTFFHNLLNAEFLSGAEMEYMAKRVNLELQKGTYYAAMIRLFPQIDVESIDGTTVEEARSLQILVKEKLESIYKLPLWSYKKNTLVTMYVIEVEDEKQIMKALQEVISWLREEIHVDAYWGIGTPCKDLLSFWKSAEEANTALVHNEKEMAVCLYSDIKIFDDTFYLPYSVEDYLAKGLRGGDIKAVKEVLQMIKNENFVRRNINRKQFLKLNQSICDILAIQLGEMDGNENRLIYLSSIIGEKKGEYKEYFAYLELVCEDICKYSVGQKNKKRHEKMEAILGFIQENYSNSSMGLGMVSEHCKLSEGYLSAMFKEEMDINFGDYIEKIRIEKACELLLKGELVADIAEKTGYNSVQSFRRAFKRVKDVSPSEYRA